MPPSPLPTRRSGIATSRRRSWSSKPGGHPRADGHVAGGVATAADGRADNPFESVLRAHAIEAGLDVEPQVPIRIGGAWCRPDLLDERRALALEAESFTWHGDRTQLTRDCVKHNGLTLLGLRVLRFSWEQVVLAPADVRGVLERARTGVAPWHGAQATRPDQERRPSRW